MTTKLFCGYCKEMMIGYGGTGKMGLAYHYYACKKAKKKQCKKRIVKKTYIENHVIAECLSLLTEDNIRLIAKNVAAEFEGDTDTTIIKKLKSAIRDTDNAIENLWRGIEQGQSVEMLTERINMRKAERDELEGKLALMENKQFILTEPEIYAFLNYIRKLPKDDVNKRRALINIFVNAILLYDDHYTLILNAGNRVITIDDIPLDDIENAFESKTGNLSSVSSMVADAPPIKEPPFGWLFYCRRGVETSSEGAE